MRFLLKVAVPHEQFNSYVKDGSIDKKMQSIMAETKPEAAYFTELNGKRTALLIVNIDNPSQIPSLGEPWFLLFNADVEFHPVMLGEDLGKANLGELGKKWK
jgi:hypothetical protein